MNVKIEIKGDKKILQEIRRLAKAYPKAAMDAVREEALDLKRRSQLIVPIDTGILKGSAFIEERGEGRTFEATVGYSANYAIPVHERTEVKHPVGEAKFLEKPFQATIANYFERLAARIRTLIK